MTTPRALIVLQARLGSTRLPGKVLACLAGRSVLAHCIERLKASGVGPVIVATTWRDEDEAVVREAERFGAPVFRGPVDDVLQRFLLVADSVSAPLLVRATADNPAVDIDAPSRVLDLLIRESADHVVESGLPVGAAVEAVRVAALRRAGQETNEPYDREHVTPYLRARIDRFKALAPRPPAGLERPDLRFTIDTPGDLAFMRRVFESIEAGADPVPLSRIIGAADALCAKEPSR